MTRAALALALLATLAALATAARHYRAAAIEAQAAASAAEQALTFGARAAEIGQAATYTMGEITRDAYAAPDAGACGLGLRDAENLNRLR